MMTELELTQHLRKAQIVTLVSMGLGLFNVFFIYYFIFCVGKGALTP